MTTVEKRLQPATFAFAILGVPEVASTVDFFTRGAALRAVDPDAGSAGLATADGRVSLVVSASGRRGLQRLGYAVADRSTLDRFQAVLGSAGVPTTRGPIARLAEDALCFDDPDGYPLALAVRAEPARPVAPRGLVTVEEILHPLIQVHDLDRSMAFYGDLLGFQTSDRIADVTAFMRCADQFHHSLAITVARGAFEIDHLCFHLPDLDTVMRVRNRLRRVVAAECTETFRHGGSESITFYFQDPNSGVQIEYCAEHRMVRAPDHQPRVLPAVATTFDLWERYSDEDGLVL